MTVYNVSNTTQFNSALSHAAGGDTIVMAAGNYGSSWISNKNYNTAVTIKSASTLNRAHFDYLQVGGSSNLRFEGLDVGHSRTSGETENTQYARVQDSNGIKMIGMAFHGSLDNNPANDGMGLNVINTSNFQLLGSSFRDLARGAFVQQSSNVTVASNSFQTIRTDGLDVGAVNGAVIDKNSFTNFHPVAGDHADAIQFWLTGQPYGSSNIQITGNTILQGSGTGMQGIFMTDPMSFGYKNVLIQNNLIYGNDQYNGIFVDGATGVQVIGNTILSNSTDAKQMWIDLVGGSNFTVRDNIADNILVQPGVTGVTMSHNANLAQMGWLRSQIPNVNAPTAAKDLIVADYGYHLPGTVTATSAPTSTVVGQSIASTDLATSTQVSKTMITDVVEQPTVAAPAAVPSYSEVFSSPTPTVTLAASDPVLAKHSLAQLHFDHYVAMA